MNLAQKCLERLEDVGGSWAAAVISSAEGYDEESTSRKDPYYSFDIAVFSDGSELRWSHRRNKFVVRSPKPPSRPGSTKERGNG